MANKPNNPSLWSKAKSLAKQKFDVYPSAYANGWAAKYYKSKGGTWRKAEYGMQVMGDGGIPDNEGFNALPERVQQMIISRMEQGGEKMPPEIARARFAAAGNLNQMADYGYACGGYIPEMMYGGMDYMAGGGEPNGGMALGQMSAVAEKMSKLRQFVSPEQNLDPWIASKLAVMDHSADAISDYMMYNPEAQGEEQEMMEGGGYVVSRSSDRKGKTHKVTGPDGTEKYFGDSNLGQHPKDPERKAAFYARHKKNLDGNPYFRAFARATWQDGGQIDEMKNGGSTYSNGVFYQTGGEAPRMEDYPDYGSWRSDFEAYLMAANDAQVPSKSPGVSRVNGDDESYDADGNYYPGKEGQRYMDALSNSNHPDHIAALDAANRDNYTMMVPSIRIADKAQATPKALPGKKGQGSGSIVDFLNSSGNKSDYATRKALAEERGIASYRGTADQNMMLLSILRQENSAAPVTRQSASADYDMNSSNMLRRGYVPPSNPFIFGEMPQRQAVAKERPVVKTPAAAKVSAAKKVNAVNAKDAEESMTFAKYKAKDPYFFAEESDSGFKKAIDMPFTYLRDLGARTVLDKDVMALGQLLSLGAGSSLLKGITRAGISSRFNKFVDDAPDDIDDAGSMVWKSNNNTIHGMRAAAAEIMKSPGSLSASRKKALSNQKRKQEGGPVVGQEMEVTPEQLEQLRAQGIQFEII